MEFVLETSVNFFTRATANSANTLGNKCLSFYLVVSVVVSPSLGCNSDNELISWCNRSMPWDV